MEANEHRRVRWAENEGGGDTGGEGKRREQGRDRERKLVRIECWFCAAKAIKVK